MEATAVDHRLREPVNIKAVVVARLADSPELPRTLRRRLSVELAVEVDSAVELPQEVTVDSLGEQLPEAAIRLRSTMADRVVVVVLREASRMPVQAALPTPDLPEEVILEGLQEDRLDLVLARDPLADRVVTVVVTPKK